MNINNLSEMWHSAGIEKGDSVLLHSNVKRLTRKLLRSGNKKPLDAILQSFINAVGTEGTLIFPLFNFDFTSGVTFDINKTPSQMGSITELARLKAGEARSGHPVYSFCAFGKYADQISKINNRSAYAKDSPFGFLHKVKGKISILDLEDQESMTFYHYIEEASQVKYRFMKNFSGQYIDKSGKETKQTYSIYVRDLNKKISTDVNPAGEEMWKEGIYKGFPPGINSGLRTAYAEEIFNFIKEKIDLGKAEGLLYSYSK